MIMTLTHQAMVSADDGQHRAQEILVIERESLQPEPFGLTVAEWMRALPRKACSRFADSSSPCWRMRPSPEPLKGSVDPDEEIRVLDAFPLEALFPIGPLEPGKPSQVFRQLPNHDHFALDDGFVGPFTFVSNNVTGSSCSAQNGPPS
jgi:hypothetical protein